ncbi:MAG: cbb3-type cytochrome oxidase assembly protein CcoS [Panacagrimonas sp.]
MESLFLLIPLGLMLVLAAGWTFFRAASSGQFDALNEQQGRMPDDEAQQGADLECKPPFMR